MMVNKTLGDLLADKRNNPSYSHEYPDDLDLIILQKESEIMRRFVQSLVEEGLTIRQTIALINKMKYVVLDAKLNL